MIDLVAEKEEGEVRDGMIHVLANYMRQQYLIWNKDTVTEETILKILSLFPAEGFQFLRKCT